MYIEKNFGEAKSEVAGIVMLDRSSPVPLYHQLSEMLLDRILEGHLQPNDAIPTERELIDLCGVSRITVRRALDELERRGFVQRVQGRGTFVRTSQVQRSISRLTSFTEEIKARGMAPDVRLLALRREPATGRVAHALQIEEGRPVWLVKRLRLADKEAIAINISYLYLPPQVEITSDELRSEVSLWSLLSKKGIMMAEADKTIEATVADSEQSDLLGVPRSAPLLLVEGVVYSGDGTPIEFHQIIGRGDRYKFYLHVTR